MSLIVFGCKGRQWWTCLYIFHFLNEDDSWDVCWRIRAGLHRGGTREKCRRSYTDGSWVINSAICSPSRLVKSPSWARLGVCHGSGGVDTTSMIMKPRKRRRSASLGTPCRRRLGKFLALKRSLQRSLPFALQHWLLCWSHWHERSGDHCIYPGCTEGGGRLHQPCLEIRLCFSAKDLLKCPLCHQLFRQAGHRFIIEQDVLFFRPRALKGSTCTMLWVHVLQEALEIRKKCGFKLEGSLCIDLGSDCAIDRLAHSVESSCPGCGKEALVTLMTDSDSIHHYELTARFTGLGASTHSQRRHSKTSWSGALLDIEHFYCGILGSCPSRLQKHPRLQH